MATTRRGFLAGAVASGVAGPTLADAQTPMPMAPGRNEQKLIRRGRAIAVAPKGGRVVVAHDGRRTIAIAGGGRRRIVDVGGRPVEVAVSPDGKRAAATTGFWDEPGLALVGLTGGKPRRIAAGPAPFGVGFSPDGSRLAVSGGEQEGALQIFDSRTLRLLNTVELGVCPRALALTRGGDAWVALNGSNEVVRVDLDGARITRTIRMSALPDRIAVSADGKRLLVSHGGHKATRVSEIEILGGRQTQRPAGAMPSGVAWGPRGTRLVALGGTGEILAISAGGRRRLHGVGGSPRGLAVAGRRAWTVDALSGAIRSVKL